MGRWQAEFGNPRLMLLSVSETIGATRAKHLPLSFATFARSSSITDVCTCSRRAGSSTHPQSTTLYESSYSHSDPASIFICLNICVAASITKTGFYIAATRPVFRTSRVQRPLREWILRAVSGAAISQQLLSNFTVYREVVYIHVIRIEREYSGSVLQLSSGIRIFKTQSYPEWKISVSGRIILHSENFHPLYSQRFSSQAISTHADSSLETEQLSTETYADNR